MSNKIFTKYECKSLTKYEYGYKILPYLSYKSLTKYELHELCQIWVIKILPNLSNVDLSL